MNARLFTKEDWIQRYPGPTDTQWCHSSYGYRGYLPITIYIGCSITSLLHVGIRQRKSEGPERKGSYVDNIQVRERHYNPTQTFWISMRPRGTVDFKTERNINSTVQTSLEGGFSTPNPWRRWAWTPLLLNEMQNTHTILVSLCP